MSMYFFDETDDWPEYQTIRDEIQRLEKEHLAVSQDLNEARSTCTSDPTDKGLKANMEGLERKLKEIEKKLDESLSMYR
jgi:hypothetical protein